LLGRITSDWIEILEKKSLELSEMQKLGRLAVLRQTAVGDIEPGMALNILDAMRWFNRVGYHAWAFAIISVAGKMKNHLCQKNRYK